MGSDIIKTPMSNDQLDDQQPEHWTSSSGSSTSTLQTLNIIKTSMINWMRSTWTLDIIFRISNHHDKYYVAVSWCKISMLSFQYLSRQVYHKTSWLINIIQHRKLQKCHPKSSGSTHIDEQPSLSLNIASSRSWNIRCYCKSSNINIKKL